METTIGLSRLLSGGGTQGANTSDNLTSSRKMAEEIVKRQKRLEHIRQPQDHTWDNTDRFVTSRRSHYNVGYIRGDSAEDAGGSAIYDDAAADSIQKFADNFQAQSASPLIKWSEARFRGPLRSDSRATRWLDEMQEAKNYELARSNFYEEYNECVQDAVSHGVATMAGPEWNYEKNRLEFRTFHPRNIFMWFNVLGIPIGWHDKFPMTGRQIKSEWPDAKLTPVMENKIKENAFREFMVIHAIYHRDERDIKSPAATDKKWASVWVVESEKIVLHESGYDDLDMPMDTWIWRKGGSGLYAFCPATDALYGVMMENDAAKSLLEAIQLSTQPPLIISEGVKGNVNFFPLGQTVLHNPNDKVQAFQFPTNFAISVEALTDLRKQIAVRFRADVFTMMNDLPAGTKAFTASQVAGEKASGLIPIVTRSSSQMLIPKQDKTIRELAKAGRLTPPPASIMQHMRSPVDTEMTGPVATAAKRFLSQQGFNAMMAQIQEISATTAHQPQLLAAVLEGFNPDEIRKFLVESNSVTQRLLFSDEELAQIRKAKADAAKQQQAMQKLQGLAQASKDGGQAPDPGSMAAQVMGGK
jgi:hypothetical protein